MHWCLGIYASASTWIFNVTLKTAAALHPGQSIVGRYVTVHSELGFLDEPTSIPIVKTHDTDTPAEVELARRATAILVSIRDPRDCLASLLLYQQLPFDDALGKVERSALICDRLASDPRTVLLRYEDGFTGDPMTIDRIASTFGRALTNDTRDRIFHETERSAVEALISQLDMLPTVHHHTDPLETLDMVTQWHRHHAGRTGEVGRWRRELNQRQLDEIERRLHGFMARYAYTGLQSTP
jgi:Sulfotransferase domain